MSEQMEMYSQQIKVKITLNEVNLRAWQMQRAFFSRAFFSTTFHVRNHLQIIIFLDLVDGMIESGVCNWEHFVQTTVVAFKRVVCSKLLQYKLRR